MQVSTRSSSVAGLLLLAAAANTARPDFIPGHVYVARPSVESCNNPNFPPDQIWDIDPATGQAGLLLTVPVSLCGNIRGLAFTPDGAGLRAGMFLHNVVIETDGEGGLTVPLSGANGLGGPWGQNSIAYDQAGNFYVSNFNETILEYAPGSAMPTTFADSADGVGQGGPLAFAPNGDLYYGRVSGTTAVLRFTPQGEPTVFASFGHQNLQSVAVASNGDLYVFVATLGGQLYRYPGGDAANQQTVASGAFATGAPASIALAPGEQSLYVATPAALYSVNVTTGLVTDIPVMGANGVGGAGIAVFVPEPGTISFLCAGLALAVSRRRS
jgi:hypothetical protein